MKVIVADKISERGVELLKKSGLDTVLTTCPAGQRSFT